MRVPERLGLDGFAAEDAEEGAGGGVVGVGVGDAAGAALGAEESASVGHFELLVGDSPILGDAAGQQLVS